MEEYRRSSERRVEDAPEKIDITGLLQNFYQAVRKLWWLVILLIVLFALKSYLSVSSGYVANYAASATVTVTSNTGTSVEDLETLFPYMMSNGVLSDVIAEDLGTNGVPGSVTLKAEPDTEFLTITATCSDPQMAYDLLTSVMENYPQVAKYVLGELKFAVLDETGIPSEKGRKAVIRGSYKKGALEGALLGFVILGLYALTRNTVKSKKELKKKLNLMDCGSIPYVREKKRKKGTVHNSLNLLNDRISPAYVESIRKVRTKVLRQMEENDFKTLLVTSSIPGEGKTTLAVNLAISIANQGKKVILVDCDLRNPSIAAAMNESGEHPGLGAVLEKRAELKEAMTTIEVSGGELKVIYGKKEENTNVKILGSKRMESLIQYWSRRADIVILDTAPSGLLADAPVLARYVDAALYVVRYDHTKLRQIRDGVQSLAMSGIHIIGYVFNSDKSGGGQGYGYGYGYNRYSRYGRYNRYSAYGRYNSYANQKDEIGKEDAYGRVIKD